jgi:uncharacterized protein YndB with AHSA1/START domain
VKPEAVYRALTTDAGRASFWAESAVESGQRIEFVFADGSRYAARILEQVPPVRFSLVYFESVATFELSPDRAGGTELLLTNDGVPLSEWHEVHAGWLSVLFPLKAVLCFGVDLRNHSPSRTWNQGYADQ